MRDDDAAERARRAGDPSTPPDKLIQLIDDKDNAVRLNLINNPAVPDEVIMVFFYDLEDDIQTKARHLQIQRGLPMPQQQMRGPERTGRDFTPSRYSDNINDSISTDTSISVSMATSKEIERTITLLQVDRAAYLRFLLENSTDTSVRREAGLMLYGQQQIPPKQVEQQQQRVVLPSPSAVTPVKAGRRPSPERTIQRLVARYRAAAGEFAKLVIDSDERLAVAHTIVNAYETLKRRGFAVDTLPGRDALREARRIKRAFFRAQAKPPSEG